jgi:O-antigen ligase
VLPTLLISTTFQASITVWEVASGINWRTGTRIPGAFGSIHLWPYAASIAAVVVLLMTGSWRAKTAAAGCFVLLAAAEMFRKSRMLWIASVLGGALFAFVQARNKVAAVVLTTLTCLALSAGYVLDLYHPAVRERITMTLNPTETPDLIARIRVVQEMTAEFVDSPIVGLGLRQSAQYMSETPAPPPVVEVHNIVMHAAVEGGAVAALALILLPLAIVLLWIAARRATADRASQVLVNWLGASLIAIYIAAQLTPALYEHTFYLLIAALASFACPVPLRNRRDQPISI